MPGTVEPGTLYHNRMTRVTAMGGHSVRSAPPRDAAHHESRATTSDGRPWPPEGSLLAPFGRRQRPFTMSRIARATLPTQKTRKDDHTYHPIVIEGTSRRTHGTAVP